VNIELFDLSGKIALITGGSQGLGFAIARGLGQAGATLVLNGRDEEKLNRAVSTLSKEGLTAHASLFDVRDGNQIQKKINEAERKIGPIQILINNAAIQRIGPLETTEETAWKELIDTNLTAVFLTTKQVVRGMIQRRSGKIVNICSLTIERSRPTLGPYAASKGGVKMLTKAMAVDWAKYNIQANGIASGYFVTEMMIPAKDPSFHDWVRSRTPMGRWGDPPDLVGAAVFLASRASDFITGQIINVDGGFSANL
jgi:gluconate 5-dehydrogenase